MNRPEWVIFDLGGVVLNWLNCRDLTIKHLGFSLEEFNLVFGKYVIEMELGNITPLQGFTQILHELKKPDDPQTILNLWMNGLLQMDSTVELIQKLSLSYKLGVCTNNWVGIVNQNKLMFPRAFEYFNFIVDSSITRTRKPDVDIYRTVENRANASGKSIFFIDDTLSNIETANSIGWQTYHFKDALELEKMLL